MILPKPAELLDELHQRKEPTRISIQLLPARSSLARPGLDHALIGHYESQEGTAMGKAKMNEQNLLGSIFIGKCKRQ
jgi:hypothetical protein